MTIYLMSLKPVIYTVDYAVTLTLKTKMRDLETERQYNASSQEVIQLFTCNNIKATIIYELTKNDDIHYHGICKMPLQKHIRDNVIWLRNRFRRNKIIGFVCIKPVDDYHKWVEYISKDIATTKQRLGNIPILMDDYDIYPDRLLKF